MNDLNTAIVNANQIMSGQRVLEVKATVDPMGVLMLAIGVFVAVTLGSLIANAIIR